MNRMTLRACARLVAVICLTMEACAAYAATPNCTPTDASPVWKGNGAPLKVLALGTSLMWGNGLKLPRTFRYQVAEEVAKRTGRPVQLTTFAHSAALLGLAGQGASTEGVSTWTWGDLNYSEPSVHDQMDCAADATATSDADLILLDGCINEVGAESIPLPWTKPADLEDRTKKACGRMMKDELEHLAARFPHATVVVIGYYPLVSRASGTGWLTGTSRLEKHAKKRDRARHNGVTSQVTKDTRSKAQKKVDMKDNSELFYQLSKKKISEAVNHANTVFTDGPHMFFAHLPEVPVQENGKTVLTVDPDFAFAAPKSNMWLVPIPLIWHWGFFRDQKFGVRHDECEAHVTDFVQRQVCKVNPAFHPNAKGAHAYAEVILMAIPRAKISEWAAAHP